MEFGKSLREAREAKGYTIAQVAEMTHIMTSVLEGLENEDFSRIAAPIYGRGFVKLYCQAVGLEAKPLVDEFMAIMNGEHEILIKERPVARTDESIPAPAPAPADPIPPREPIVEQDLFTQSEPVAAEPPPARVPIPAPNPIPAPEPIPANEPKVGLSRYASPLHSEARMPSDLPGLPWRLILLGIAGLAILLILVFGIRALYRATSAESAPETETAPAIPAATVPAAQSAAKPTVRTQQQNIPSLYID